MHPILFEVPLPFRIFGHEVFVLRSFGVMTMLGVLAGALWLARALRRIGVEDRDAVGDLVTACVLTGFVGARVLYVAVHPDVWHGPISLIAVWEGGIVSYGGFFGGALGGIWYARRKGIPVRRLGDAVLPALALGQVFGRIGCFLVGDDYGRPWDGPWAVSFPAVEGGLIPADLVGVPLHPAQLYLSLMNLVLFGVTAWLFARRRFDGQVLAATMALYAVGRFGVEFTRGDDFERGGLGVLSTAQWWSLATVALAALLYARFRARAVAVA